MADFVNTKNASLGRGDKYAGVIKEIADHGKCPFCPENLANHHKPPILHETDNWLLTDNMYPYAGSKQHLLIIHRAHIETIGEVDPEVWSELQIIIGFAQKLRDIRGAAFLMRFGETAYNGASVAHLHAQLISGSGEPDATPVITRVG
jgi:diadenosine tetraphosphate (Ap4A) HIT family hydrolase